MNLFDQCSRTLQLSLLAMLCACGGGLERDDGVAPGEADALTTQIATKDVACVTPGAGPGIKADAGLDGGPGLATDSGKGQEPSTALGSRPGDRCSPAGEGDFPWAPCDATRGLVCVPPDRGRLDAPSTCRCPVGKVFMEGACIPQ